MKLELREKLPWEWGMRRLADTLLEQLIGSYYITHVTRLPVEARSS